MNYKFHKLDDGLAYMSVQTGAGQTFNVYTTPISADPEPVHRQILEAKLAAAGISSVKKKSK